MGKRKSSSKIPAGATNKKKTLPQQFQCLFCNNETSVTVNLDRKTGNASLACKVCSQDFHTTVNFLDEGVDVYARWIDACEAAADNASARARKKARVSDYAGTMRSAKKLSPPQESYGNDDFVVDDDDEEDSLKHKSPRARRSSDED